MRQKGSIFGAGTGRNTEQTVSKLVPPDVREYIEEGEKMEKVSKPKAKNEEKESGEEQNQAEQPQDIQSV